MNRSWINRVVHVVPIVAACVMLTAAAAHTSAASVSGTITADGVPVADARVTLFTESLDVFHETRSNADGTYEITSVEPDSYTLDVAALNFDYEQFAIIIGSEPLEQNFALVPESHPGSWQVIADTAPESLDGTNIGVLLADGTLIYCHNTINPVRINPVTGEKVFPASSGAVQGCMHVALDSDGRLLTIGGSSGFFGNAKPWLKAYDVLVNQWQWLPDMNLTSGRFYPGLARLADGSLLVMGGGMAPNAARTETCEIFDFDSMQWSDTGDMLNPTDYPPAALLHTGEVLATWWPAQRFNPKTGQWTATGPLVQPNRGWPGHADHGMIVLSDGRAIIVGVRFGPDNNTGMVEMFDPETDQWSLASNPWLLREFPEIAYLPHGCVFVAGGRAHSTPPVPNLANYVKIADLYDPHNDAWRELAPMLNFRDMHGITLLIPDGRVTVTGGTQFGGQSAITDLEAFSPPYLFRGVRPQITSISNNAPKRGETITLDIFPATQLTSVVLMGMQTNTHWVHGGIPRRIVLPVEQNGSSKSVVVTLPTDPNLLVVGHYMLFAMVDDIPSVAQIIQVHPAEPCPPIVGDLSCDGTVGVADLLILLANWGPCPGCKNCPADLTGSCSVGVADLLILLANWG